MKKVSNNLQDTAKIAMIFLDKIFQKNGKKKKATVICLSGDLGAGKTAFSKNAGKILGIKQHMVSPTFIIFKRYKIKKGNYKFLYHIDAYRLKHGQEMLVLGWKEIIKNPENLVFVEWPENIKEIIPRGAKYIYIEHGKGHTRIFKF